MRDQLTEAERRDRATLDGRVAFASAAIASAAALIVLLDRIGLPERGSKWLSVLTLVCALGLIGVLVRAARISTFYVAGRAAPASWSGLAIAAVVAGMGLIFLPPLPQNLSGPTLLAGVAGGLAGFGLLAAPLIRKSGAFSAADLLSARFPALLARLCMVALAAAICGLAALAGLSEAVRILGAQMGLSPALAAGLSGGVLFLSLAPGGLRGLTWSAAAAGGMLLAALAGPVLLLVSQNIPLPAPVIGSPEAWAHAAGRIADWGVLAGGAPGWLALPIALGIAAFAPLLGLPAGTRNRVGAQNCAGMGLIWLALIGFAVAMTMALGAIGLDVALIGQRPDRLADAFYQASGDGFISICGQHAGGPAQARAACASVPGFSGLLRAGDVAATMDFLAFGLADAQSLGGAWRALTLAGWLGACLALAAAGVQGLATALGHDLFYRVRDRASITSRRLATTRLTLVASLLFLCVVAAQGEVDPRLWLALSLLLCAAGLAPLLMLAFWPRAGSAEAILALVTGLGAAGWSLFALLVNGALLADAMGLAALAGAGFGLLTGFVVSLRPDVDPAHGAAFRQRMFRPGADALTPDRGA